MKKTSSADTEDARPERPRRCNFCGAEAPLVWVHGHGQCANCGTNAEECCRGEQCGGTPTD